MSSERRIDGPAAGELIAGEDRARRARALLPADSIPGSLALPAPCGYVLGRRFVASSPVGVK
jgi:hypothetical protein